MSDIEDFNKRIIACRMFKQELVQEYNTAQPIVHQEMVNDVIEHRSVWGITSRFSILRGLVRTRKYVRLNKC